MVIVAACVAYVLERVACPSLDSHLRVLDTADDTELHVCLVSGNAIHKSSVLTAERSAHGVTDVIAERTHLVKHISVSLEGDLLCWECRSLRCPALTVDHHVRIDRVETLADLVHSVDVVDGHKVEAESVDVVLLHPPLERLDHILAEHLLLRCSLVAAARTVEERSVLTHTVEVAWHCALETCL